MILQLIFFQENASIYLTYLFLPNIYVILKKLIVNLLEI